MSVTANYHPDPNLAAEDEEHARGAEVFRKCAVCHAVTPESGRRAGPTLYGVFGRQAGTVPNYNYSTTLQKSDVVWSAATISKLFDLGPDIYMPGTKMPVQRIPDPEDRRALNAYLLKITQPPQGTVR